MWNSRVRFSQNRSLQSGESDSVRIGLCSLEDKGWKPLSVGTLWATDFDNSQNNNSRKSKGQFFSGTFTPRLYISYIHAYAPGQQYGGVLAPGPTPIVPNLNQNPWSRKSGPSHKRNGSLLQMLWKNKKRVLGVMKALLARYRRPGDFRCPF